LPTPGPLHVLLPKHYVLWKSPLLTQCLSPSSLDPGEIPVGAVSGRAQLLAGPHKSRFVLVFGSIFLPYFFVSFLPSFLSFFPWLWGFNSGIHTCWAGTLPLKPCPQPSPLLLNGSCLWFLSPVEILFGTRINKKKVSN
jgi:hypothetical protein